MALKSSSICAVIIWTILSVVMLSIIMHLKFQITNKLIGVKQKVSSKQFPSEFIVRMKNYGNATVVYYKPNLISYYKSSVSYTISDKSVHRGKDNQSQQVDLETLMQKQNKPLITWICSDRLGNHMFIHATAYALAQKTNHSATIVESSYLSRYYEGIKAFPVSTQFIKSLPTTDIYEKGPLMYTPWLVEDIKQQSHVRLHGHYQSWKYFQDYEDDIRQQFRIDKKTLYFVEANIKHILKQKLKSTTIRPLTVGIHIRRGDITNEKRIRNGLGPAPIGYIQRAMNYYRNKYRGVIFVVCSNDIEWSVTNIGDAKDVIYIHGSSIHDLATLSICNHTIVTTGSYGWWAGWLAGGQVVYYSKYPTPGSPVGMMFQSTDYYPPNWIPMT